MTHGGSSSIGRALGRDPGDEEFEPPLSPQSLYWLAGLLEGEGSFLKPPPSKPTRVILSVEMTDRDLLERVAAMLAVSVYVVPLYGTHQQVATQLPRHPAQREGGATHADIETADGIPPTAADQYGPRSPRSRIEHAKSSEIDRQALPRDRPPP